MDNTYLVVNGVKVPLTEEQKKSLGITKEKNNPFERVNKGTVYYYGKADGTTEDFTEADDSTDTGLYNAANYFNDKQFAGQVILHQLLYRKLLKYAYDNGYVDTAKWDGENPHWCIYYDNCCKKFNTTWQELVQYSHVYFSTREGAACAIKEVIEPFVKEHPEFVW